MGSAELVAGAAQAWLDIDANPSTRAEIAGLLESEAWEDLEGRLGSRLEFGTAGLRGLQGAGYSRMNNVTVQQTTQGLCCYLERVAPTQLAENGVAIGFDARYNSEEYATIAAAVFVSRGVPVRMFAAPVPTPLLAAAVSYGGCAGGIMVTASHNPKEYNGYKVYWGNGPQIIPPHDAGIAAAIEETLDLWDLPSIVGSPLVSDPTHDVKTRYFEEIVKQGSFREASENAKAEAAVYTPLHGVGLESVLSAFHAFGLPTPIIVPEQANPDPEFPTVVFPNPEEGKGTWSRAFATARECGARLVLANDPDADRLAVAEPDASQPDGFRTFTGNEIGTMLAAWLWGNYKAAHPDADASNTAMLASTVSSKMLAAMGRVEGFHFEETLTGFKWLGNRAIDLEAEGRTVLFAYEEAIGFMLGPIVKDKDGVCMAAVFAEMAADLRTKGLTLQQYLTSLEEKYGTFEYRAGYFVADDPSSTAAVFQRIRAEYPKQLGGIEVTGVRDMGTGMDTTQPDGTPVLPWIEGELMITLYLAGGGTLTVRASGTEPKLKYYLEVTDADAAAAKSAADTLLAAVSAELIKPEQHDLRLPIID